MDDLNKFATSIRKKYRQRLINREKQWPPCHSNKLVRLELVERKNETYSEYQQKVREAKNITRTPLAYSDLFKADSWGKSVVKVLVEGDAGIGKTTLCISVSEDWANGKLFQQFELVLLLPLRMKIVASAGSLPELLKLLHPKPRICESVARYLEEEEGESVLIIADGWDELDESQRNEGSFLYNLLIKALPFASVIITSRPSASALFHRFCDIDQFVEVRGFSEEHIIEYIKSEFASDQEKAGRLLEQLEQNPLVESVCSVPLNCAIICHLWRALEEALPTTMTELYKKIILNFILRNIRKLDSYRDVGIFANFSSLPKGLQQSWWRLCEFAFDSLIKNQIVFSQEELTKFFSEDLPLDERILCFGLMQPTELILATGSGVSFHFHHLTFQEYLAALHMVKQPSCLALQSLKSYADSAAIFYAVSDNFMMVWRFYFGVYFQESTEGGKRPDMQLVSQHMSGIKEFINDDLLLWHCAFEARNTMIIYEAIRSLESFYGHAYTTILTSGIEFEGLSTAHDCAAIIYVIDNIQECSKMEIDFDDSGIRENQIKILTDVLASKHGKVQVKKLSLSGCKLSDRNVGDLFQRASSAFQLLEDLNLNNNKVGAESINSITTVLSESSSSKLEYLDLSHNPLGVLGLQALEDAVRNKLLSNLQRLCLQGSLTSDADINGALVCTLIEEALMAHCPKLYKLDLSQNNLGVPGLVEQNQSCLNRVMLGDVELNTLVENVEIYHIRELELKDNGIHGSGILCLPKGLFFEYFTSLYLDDNPLGLEGAIAISEILRKNYCHLRTLGLSNCQLTESEYDHHSSDRKFRHVGQELYQMPQNSTITMLFLQENNFNGERLHILSGLMFLCTNLEYLTSYRCQINSDDLKKLLNELDEHKSSFPSICSQLVEWDLDDNQLSDSGVSALLDHLPSLFPQLVDITIRNNPVSSMMAIKVEEVMQKREQTLQAVKEASKNVWQIGADSSLEKQNSQTQWEVIVSLLYQTTIEELLPNCSCIHLEVVGEEGNLHVNNSSLGKDVIHTQNVTESSVKDDHDGPVSSLPMSLPPVHTICMCTPADDSEIISENIPQFSEEVSTPDYEEKTDVNPPTLPLVVTDESSSPTQQVITVSPCLTVDDLASVQTAVWEGRAKWYNIGLQLGLTAGTMDAIQQTNHSNTDLCFTATLKEWLSRGDLHRSWSHLATSLRAPPVGLGHLAEQLMANTNAN